MKGKENYLQKNGVQNIINVSTVKNNNFDYHCTQILSLLSVSDQFGQFHAVATGKFRTPASSRMIFFETIVDDFKPSAFVTNLKD